MLSFVMSLRLCSNATSRGEIVALKHCAVSIQLVINSGSIGCSCGCSSIDPKGVHVISVNRHIIKI